MKNPNIKKEDELAYKAYLEAEETRAKAENQPSRSSTHPIVVFADGVPVYTREND